MLNSPARFSGLSLPDIFLHLQNFVAHSENNSCIEIGLSPDGPIVPIRKRTYKIKSSNLIVNIRVSDIGRNQIININRSLSALGFQITKRRSQKRKLLSQIHVSVPIDSDCFNQSIRQIFWQICRELSISWPPEFAIGYAMDEIPKGMPGKFECRYGLYLLGYKLGLIVGKISRIF